MEVFRDDYKLNPVCIDEPSSDSEEDEPSRDYIGGVIGSQYYYGHPQPERRVRTAPIPESAADSRRPRYCAKFHFGVVEGIMRIYPSGSTPSSLEWTTVKNNPTFQFRWRGRDTGEGQIQLEALEFSSRNMTFSDSGLKVEGVFDCPYISGGLRFTGTKTSHGRDQKLSSAREWRELNEKAWNEESSSRWD
jgi:hypothetical protein